MVAFIGMLLLAMPAQVSTQSGFGGRWAGMGGFHDYYGSGRDAWGRGFDDRRYQGYADDYEDDYYDDYYGHRYEAPCPEYQATELTSWRVAAGRQQQPSISMQVSFPGVEHQHMDAWLSKDSSAVHVQGFRSLPARGRECLPAHAKVSADGQYEILEAAIPVPRVGDANGASVHHVRGGLRIDMPRRTPPRTASPARDARRHAAAARVDVDAHRHEDPIAEAPPSEQTASRRSQAAIQKVVSNMAKRTPLVLPWSNQGIEIEDDEFPWPEKHADACEGWLDNRGEFQFY